MTITPIQNNNGLEDFKGLLVAILDSALSRPQFRLYTSQLALYMDPLLDRFCTWRLDGAKTRVMTLRGAA